jgi:hypothetical protein
MPFHKPKLQACARRSNPIPAHWGVNKTSKAIKREAGRAVDGTVDLAAGRRRDMF